MVFLRKHKWKSCLSMLILGAANLFLINVVFIADDPERTGTNRFFGSNKILEHSNSRTGQFRGNSLRN